MPHSFPSRRSADLVAAAAGARVAVAEVSRVGGTCVIRGCVPKKMFVYGAQFAKDGRYRERLGWAGTEGTFDCQVLRDNRSEEHTSELQSLMRISYAVFCLKKKNTK